VSGALTKCCKKIMKRVMSRWPIVKASQNLTAKTPKIHFHKFVALSKTALGGRILRRRANAPVEIRKAKANSNLNPPKKIH